MAGGQRRKPLVTQEDFQEVKRTEEGSGPEVWGHAGWFCNKLSSRLPSPCRSSHFPYQGRWELSLSLPGSLVANSLDIGPGKGPLERWAGHRQGVCVLLDRAGRPFPAFAGSFLLCSQALAKALKNLVSWPSIGALSLCGVSGPGPPDRQPRPQAAGPAAGAAPAASICGFLLVNKGPFGSDHASRPVSALTVQDSEAGGGQACRFPLRCGQ